MALEGVGEHHGGEFAGGVLVFAGGEGVARVLEGEEVAVDVAGACAEEDADVAIGGLGA